MKRSLLALMLGLAGCVEVVQPVAPPAARAAGPVGIGTLDRVVRVVIPVAERECRARTRRQSCDYAVALDQNPRSQPNAFQSLTPDGRPQIVITQTLLRDLRNSDELAFILGHEAAHHILGHLARTNTNATLGAVLGGVLADALGAGYAGVDTAQRAGALVGSRAYSKDYELDADRLGAVVTLEAGYDPVRGVAYFARAADPGNAFLGSHPPNAARIQAVRETVAGR